MQHHIISKQGKQVGVLDINDAFMSNSINPKVISQVIKWQLDKKHIYSQHLKTVSEVSGSTRKIYKQKGTGNARHSSRKVPIFRGGAVALAHKNKVYEYSLPKKIRQLGLKMALSEKLQKGRLIFIEDLSLQDIKSATALNVVEQLFNNQIISLATLAQELKLKTGSRKGANHKAARNQSQNLNQPQEIEGKSQEQLQLEIDKNNFKSESIAKKKCRILFVGDKESAHNWLLASRNLFNYNFLPPIGLNVFDILKSHYLVCDKNVWDQVVRRVAC